MKNPFKHKDHSLLTAGAVIGALSAGAAAYLFFTEAGNSLRRKVVDRLNHKTNNSGDSTSEQPVDHSKDYMKKPRKTAKTDRDALVHNEILHSDESHKQSE